MERKPVLYQIQEWRKERTLAHEGGHLPPKIPELCYPQEPVELHSPSWFPREPHVLEEIIFPRPIDPNPYEAHRVYHWEQRRRMRRINDSGRR